MVVVAELVVVVAVAVESGKLVVEVVAAAIVVPVEFEAAVGAVVAAAEWVVSQWFEFVVEMVGRFAMIVVVAAAKAGSWVSM